MSSANVPQDLVIDVHALDKTYGTVHALEGLDLSVGRHSIFGFLGPNGAGKTTAIKLLLGLARPTSGSGTIFGLDIVRDSLEIRKRVGYLAQDPRFYDTMSARETLRFTASFFYSGPGAAVERRINETLELVGLDDKADRPTKGFSGGERQRLGIAQAQINHPDLLILDEPAAALDPLGRRDVLEVMERLRADTTIFYSTHILADVERVSDSVAILNRGRLVASAPIGELLGSGRIRFDLVIKGVLGPTKKRVEALPWVTSVHASERDGATDWSVSVDDAAAAEAHLLRTVMADPSLSVISFGRHQQDLEEVFMGLVEGAGDGC